MTQLGKTIAVVGAVLLVLGVIVWLAGKAGFRGLPGDLAFESRNTRIFLPIATCVVLSIVVSVIVWLVRMLSR